MESSPGNETRGESAGGTGLSLRVTKGSLERGGEFEWLTDWMGGLGGGGGGGGLESRVVVGMREFGGGRLTPD